MFLSSVRSESNSVKAFIFFMFLTTSSISSIVYYSLALFNSSLWRIQIIMNKPIHNLISVSQTKSKKYTIQCQNEIQEEIKTYRVINKKIHLWMNEWIFKTFCKEDTEQLPSCHQHSPALCLSGVHEGDGGLLPPAGLVHPVSWCRDGVQQRRPAGGGGPVRRTVVAGQEAAVYGFLRWSDSLCQHPEEVTVTHLNTWWSNFIHWTHFWLIDWFLYSKTEHVIQRIQKITC